MVHGFDASPRQLPNAGLAACRTTDPLVCRHLDPAFRAALIVKEVTKCDPDVVTMQEVQHSVFTEHLAPGLVAAGYEGHFAPMLRGIAVGQATFFKASHFTAQCIIPVGMQHLLKGLKAQFAHGLYGPGQSPPPSKVFSQHPAQEICMTVNSAQGGSITVSSGAAILPSAFGDASDAAAIEQPPSEATPAAAAATAAGEGSAAVDARAASSVATEQLAALSTAFPDLLLPPGVAAHIPAAFPDLVWGPEAAALEKLHGQKTSEQGAIVKLITSVPKQLGKMVMLGQVALVTVLHRAGSPTPLVVTNFHAFWDPRWEDIKAVQKLLLLHWLRQVDVFASSGKPPSAPWAPTSSESDLPQTPLCQHVFSGDFNCTPRLQKSDLLTVPRHMIGKRSAALMLLSPTPAALGGDGCTCQLPCAHSGHPSHRLPAFPSKPKHKKGTSAPSKASAEKRMRFAWTLPSLTQLLSEQPFRCPWRWTNTYTSVMGQDLPWTNWHPGFEGTLDFIFVAGPNIRAQAVMGMKAVVGAKHVSLQDIMLVEGLEGCPNRLTGSDHIPVAADIDLMASGEGTG